MSQFTNSQDYEKKSHDMTLLTKIEKKVKQNEDLTREELIFLYEIDEEIHSFGQAKDPRIQQIKNKRNIFQDYALIYNVEPKQVIDQLANLNKETRVYLGKEIYFVSPDISFEEIERLSNIVGLQSDLSKVSKDIKNKITSWKGSIIDKNNNIIYNNLQSVGGHLDATSATSFEADNLQSVR